jgi:CBS domain-containing protein
MTTPLRLVLPPSVREQDSLTDHFHRIGRILPADQNVVTVSLETPVRMALQTMKKHGFSQLPVVEGEAVLGIFSYRSLGVTLLSHHSEARNPLDMFVEELMDTADATRFVQVNHELSSILDTLDRHDSVLVGTPERLQGVLTTVDVLRYLQRIAGRFVLLGEIELTIRALLRAAMTSEELTEAAAKALPNYAGKKRSSSLEEMTFGDYVQIVGSGDAWDRCRVAFGGDRDRTQVKLRRLKSLRNDVFHFKRELTDDEDRELYAGRDWLLMRARCLDLRSEKGGNQ